MISLAIALNPFAPINHACPNCGAQPTEDCPAHLLEARPGEQPIYHRERIELAVKRGMEAHARRQEHATAQRG